MLSIGVPFDEVLLIEDVSAHDIEFRDVFSPHDVVAKSRKFSRVRQYLGKNVGGIVVGVYVLEMHLLAKGNFAIAHIPDLHVTRSL